MVFPESYFENEVREGFFVPSMIKRAWAAELDVLSEIDRICRKYDIQYFAEWGTLLGAVRHNGFIPWDDDLDIGMKREDYERFLKVAEHELPEGYRINNCRVRDDFWLFLARVINTSHISFEDEHLKNAHEFPYIAGVDIFVMDYVSRDDETEHKRDVIADYIITLADYISERKIGSAEALEGLNKIRSSVCAMCAEIPKWDCNAAAMNDMKRTGMLTGNIFNYDADKVKRYLDKLQKDEELTKYISSLHRDMYVYAEKLFGMFNASQADELTQLFPFGLRRKAHRYPKEYYKDCIRLPFENITIPVPIGYDAMLRKRYGDYMKICRNRSGHDYPFFESQQAELDALTDVKLPIYRFTTKEKAYVESKVRTFDSYAHDSFKALAKDAYEELKRYDNPEDAQALAIDFGTMIEKLYGEGHDTVLLLEKYCEQLYIYACTGDGRAILEKIIDDLGKSIKKNILNVHETAFVISKTSDWKYIRKTYENEYSKGGIVYIVPVPYYHKKYDGSLYDMNYEYDIFCALLKDRPDNVRICRFDEYDMILHHPDTVYIQNPFDEWDKGISIHPQYYTENIKADCEKMVYIPAFTLYDFDENDYCQYHNADNYVLMPGVVRSDLVYVQSEEIRKVYIDKLTKWAGNDTRLIWEDKIVSCGTQKYDENEVDYTAHNISENSGKWDITGKDGKRKKIVLYHNEACFFTENKKKAFDKIEYNIKIFEQNCDNIEVIWNIQENIDDVIKKFLPEELSRYENLKKSMEQVGRIDTSSGREVVKYVDAYYGDGSYLSRLCQLREKPVMLENVDMIK